MTHFRNYARCHTTRKHKARGLCIECYNQMHNERRRNAREKKGRQRGELRLHVYWCKKCPACLILLESSRDYAGMRARMLGWGISAHDIHCPAHVRQSNFYNAYLLKVN